MDIIDHMLACIRQRTAADNDALRELESELRAEYGGERVYVPKTSEDARRELLARHRAIVRDWRAGESVALLSRRYGISRTRIYQIIREYQP